MGAHGIHHTYKWLDNATADRLFAELLTGIEWQQRKVFGGDVPRQDAWYHRNGKAYRFSGATRQACENWPDALKELLSLVEPWGVNSVLCNLYRDGRDSVAWHSDDEPGHADSIVSISLGTPRDFMVREIADHKAKRKIVAGHGDLIVMSEGSQALTEHCIPKRPKITTPRINLTFRRF
jgi:alkylated DNA repair dioxygenase AlkB